MSAHPFVKRLGRKPYWDPRNDGYPVEGAHPRLALAATAIKRKTRRWYVSPTVMAALNQGATPQCTAYGSEMWARCLPLTQHHLPPASDLYAQIRAVDVAEGRVYAEGATTLAAMKAMQALGVIGAYRWATDAEVAFNTLAFQQPVIFGSNWYWSMFNRDHEGICRITPGSKVAGGHLYAINALIVRPHSEDLLRIAQTWGDGYYYLPVSDFARLLFEDGELAVPTEVAEAPAPPRGVEDHGEGAE